MRLRICLLFTRYPFALFKESHDLEDLVFFEASACSTRHVYTVHRRIERRTYVFTLKIVDCLVVWYTNTNFQQRDILLCR